MTNDLYELILIDAAGREQARALRLNSRKQAEEWANQWNGEKAQDKRAGCWEVSCMGRMVAS